MELLHRLRPFADPLLGLAVTLLYAVEMVAWPVSPLPLALAVAATGGLGLALRRRLPLLGFVLAGAASSAWGSSRPASTTTPPP